MHSRTSPRMSRRSILHLIALASAGSLLAASQGAAPVPTAAPAKPTDAAKPAAPAAPTSAAAAAPAPTTAPATSKPAASLRTFSLRQNWYIGGFHIPWYLGKERGYFAEQGIDLDIGEGAGGAKTVQLVANKSDHFGQADGGTLMAAAAQDAPAKPVMTIHALSPFGVIFLKESGITSVRDLEGKKLAVTAGDALTQLWPAVVSANKLDADKIQLVQMDAAAKPVAVMEKRVDALLGGIADQFFLIKYRGFEPGQLRFADIGANMVGLSILVHPDFIKEQPDVIRGFVTATTRSWEDTRKDPDAAVRAALKVKQDLNAESTKDQFLVDNSLTEGPNNKGKPFGYGAKEDWDQTYDLMKRYRDLQTDKPADFFYTNEFIPGA